MAAGVVGSENSLKQQEANAETGGIRSVRASTWTQLLLRVLPRQMCNKNQAACTEAFKGQIE